MRLRVPIAIGAATVLALGGGLFATLEAQGASVHGPSAQELHRAAELRASQVGIHKIKHIIVIMQENRSFDSYFGTYPGADGIPAGICIPDPLHGGCQAPYVNHDNSNRGGPHDQTAFTADVDGGKMDGFIKEAETKCKTTDRVSRYRDRPRVWTAARFARLANPCLSRFDSQSSCWPRSP